MSQLTEFLKKYEGIRNQAYKCSAGVLTIGVGHTGPDVKVGAVWSLGEIEDALAADASKAVGIVLKAVKPKALNQNQITALASLAFNIGGGALAASTLVKKILAGDMVGAADEFLKWDKITQYGKKVSSAGLAKRRAAERELFLEGC
jgi:lysozyme